MNEKAGPTSAEIAESGHEHGRPPSFDTLKEQLRRMWKEHREIVFPGWPEPFVPLSRLLAERQPQSNHPPMPHMELLGCYPALAVPTRSGHDYEIFDFLPRRVRGEAPMMSRKLIARTFGWGLPLETSVAWLAGQIGPRPVLEVGAGAGYWASQLQRRGADVKATDLLDVARNGFTTGVRYTDIETVGAAQAAARHPEHILMMVWPPHRMDMAHSALTAYAGDTVVYIGDPRGGMCATEAFFQSLETAWQKTASCPTHLRWLGYRDTITVYRRKQTAPP
ncbi:hypothetical protein ACWEPB_26660 [Kitasatospora cineracea]